MQNSKTTTIILIGYTTEFNTCVIKRIIDSFIHSITYLFDYGVGGTTTDFASGITFFISFFLMAPIRSMLACSISCQACITCSKEPETGPTSQFRGGDDDDDGDNGGRSGGGGG